MSVPAAPSLLARLRERARARALDAVVALPEAADPRILEAAARAAEEGPARPLLVGAEDPIRAAAKAAGIGLPQSLEIVDPLDDAELETHAETLRAELVERGVSRGVEPDEVLALLQDPLGYADLLVRLGRVDGAVMGAVATTAETLRAALRVVGVDPRFRVVTSCFLMAFEDGRTLVYADCGVVPRPDAEELADIAVQAAEAHRRLVGAVDGGEPRVALLSFSTLGSARHAALDVVHGALESLERRGVDFAFDGELQADAALVAEVAERKAPGSSVAGRANVLVFPDLNSGNIAYKLTERLAGARAIGPLLQGLRGPIHDLSRGCSVEDVLDTLAITALDAARGETRETPRPRQIESDVT